MQFLEKHTAQNHTTSSSMVLLNTSEEWQRQSSLLLQARPTTTRITTKYNIPNLASPKFQSPNKRKRDSELGEKDASAVTPKIPKATLTLKTYDPESGVCLKFKTDKAADVGRLINGLGRLGRHMAALPQKTEEIIAQDTLATGPGDTQESTIPSSTIATPTDKVPQQAPGGAGKKKKKGKK